MPRPLKKVLSASRRTELVAHYPERLAEAIQAFGIERVHSLVVWSKDPRNLIAHPRLRQVAQQLPQVFVHWTVTGLGGGALEPNVPSPEILLSALPDLVAWLGTPERLHWRFDPLVEASRNGQSFGNVDLGLFRSLAGTFAQAGVKAVRTSFVTPYPKVTRRFAAAGMTAREFSPEERTVFIKQMEAVAASLGMEVLTCCEPDFPRQACIDGELLTRLHPKGEPCSHRRAAGQRALCGCTESYDVGRYFRCPNGCLYCYAQPANQ